MKQWFVVAAALIVMVGSARAEEDAEIRAAQRDLQ